MAPINDFYAFCPTDTGTNLLEQADYIAATGRTGGNVPGIASSKLNNKALRQATYVISQIAQYIANQSNTDVLDAATPATLLAQMVGVFSPVPLFYDIFTSIGSGTFNARYAFICSAANATVGATYTNNGVTFTVMQTITASTLVIMSGSSAPSFSGTLTKASGTGDSSISFQMFRAPKLIRGKAVAGGGGGSGSSSNPSITPGAAGTTGTATTFGSSLVTCNPGVGGPLVNGSVGASGGRGGTAVLGTGVLGDIIQGASGSGGSLMAASQIGWAGADGGNSPFGGAGSAGGWGGTDAFTKSATANTGSGGAGASFYDGGTTGFTGVGGGAGGYAEFLLFNPSSTYPYTIGAKGTGGAAGATGTAGGDGADGKIIIESHY